MEQSRRMIDITSRFHNAVEDWSGLKDPKARRKMQTRLNVRAHRRRKAAQNLLRAPVSHNSELTCLAQWSDADPGYACRSLPEAQSPKPVKHATFDSNLEQAGPWSVAPIDSNRHPVVRIPGVSTRGRDHFPLSLDHLIPMIEYNLIRASITNAAILDLLHLLPGSETCPPIHDKMLLFPIGRPHSIPDSLKPTTLQRCTDHEYCIDLWPDATLRDNIILAVSNGLLNHGELQADMLGTVCPNARSPAVRATYQRPSEEDGLCRIVVWTTPWCADGYELSEAFVRKYRWLLKGCYNLLQATNRWRATRGEDPIVVEL